MSKQAEAAADLDVNTIQRDEVARQVELLAARLRDSAERIERSAKLLRNTDRPAASLVAEALNDYEQNGAGPVIQGIVNELSRTR